MAVKAMNFKMDEADIGEIRRVAAVYNMTMTDVIKEALHEYINRAKQDPFYKLTANVEEATAKESEEILNEIDALSDGDLTITTVKKFV